MLIHQRVYPIAKTPNVSPGLLVKSNPHCAVFGSPSAKACSSPCGTPHPAARNVGVVSLEKNTVVWWCFWCVKDKVAEHGWTILLSKWEKNEIWSWWDWWGIIWNHHESSTKSMSRCIAKSFLPSPTVWPCLAFLKDATEKGSICSSQPFPWTSSFWMILC